MQAVFRLHLPSPSKGPEGRCFANRRPHTKSRAGCIPCKRRRIKCNEARPCCARCLRVRADCTYASSQEVARKLQDPLDDDAPTLPVPTAHVWSHPNQSLTSDMYSMSVDLLSTQLDLILAHYDRGSALDIATENVRLLQHFQANTFVTLGSQRYAKVFLSLVKRQAWDLPCLMHLILAVSSAHLKRLVPSGSSSSLNQRYALAEASHWQSGLELHRQALAGKTHDPDSTISATFLSIIFTFALEDNIPHDAYAANDLEKLAHAISPLAATGGFDALRDILGDRLKHSVWRAVLLDSDDSRGTFSIHTPGVTGLPTAFVDLCELDDNSTSATNFYLPLVRLLTPLLCLTPGHCNFTKLIAYSGRTWRYFRPLLFRKDARALLLISYWFALMRQVNQWWISTRAETECLAIVNHLRCLNDPKITALLPFPASLGQADLTYIW